MIQATTEDIPGLAAESLLRALAYFEDADKDPDPEGLSAGGWEAAKRRLADAIRDYLS